MSCSCSDAAIALHLGVTVIKAKQAVPEYEDIEALEESLALGLWSEWEKRGKAAIAAVEAALDFDAPAKASDVSKAIKTVSEHYEGWPSAEAQALIEDVVTETYRLSQQVILNKHAGTKGYAKDLVYKSKLTPSFNTVDVDAVEYLSKSQTFWAESYWDSAVRKAIESAALMEIEGLSGREVGKLIKDEFAKGLGLKGIAASGVDYFRGLAVNASTVARVSGSILSMDKLGVTAYVITNPMDERTSDICAWMNGKTFPVSAASNQIKSLVAAGDPAAVKAIHPWSPNDFQEKFAELGVEGEPGKAIPPSAAEALSKAGYGMPPYHWRCRTTVDISTSSEFAPAAE